MSNHALFRLACLTCILWRDGRRTGHAEAEHAHSMEPSDWGGAPTSKTIATQVRAHEVEVVLPRPSADLCLITGNRMLDHAA
jgi:hypothetical protein